MRRLFVLVLLIVGTMGAPRRTTAYFTSASSSSDSTFAAATIALSGVPVSSLVTFSNIYPGAAVFGTATVQNSGTGDLWYAVSDTATNADSKNLANGLQLTVAVGSAANCTLANFANLSGSIVYGPASLGSTNPATTFTLVGDATNSANVGNRSLTVGSSETLCFKVTLPDTAATTTQGASTNVTFTFTAVQKSGM